MINGVKTIGIIGGGQLGLMMLEFIRRLGLKVAVLDPDPNCPCAKRVDHYIDAKSFNDRVAFLRLAQASDVITYEFEHINVALLRILEQAGHKIYPSVDSLAIIQDKYTQNLAMEKFGIEVPKFVAIPNMEELNAYWCRYEKKPFMLKSRFGGYDGKGNFLVQHEQDLETAFKQLGGYAGEDRLMAEELVKFKRELSVVATRGLDGSCVFYPVAENTHKNSILDTTCIYDSKVDLFGNEWLGEGVWDQAVDLSRKVMECFDGVGSFCTEMFEADGRLLVNEVAPRVHNSGHPTLDACVTSQFENHIRAILGLTLGSTEMTTPFAAMKNIIGCENGKIIGFEGREKAVDLGAHVHIYDKAASKVGRKLGHFTICGKDAYGLLKKINIKAIVR